MIRCDKDGSHLIAAERSRQITAEGWSSYHDDKHSDNSLAVAAAVYATPAEDRRIGPYGLPVAWPWDLFWWKPTPDDRIRELVKAGALIAAEIDRLRRLEQHEHFLQ